MAEPRAHQILMRRDPEHPGKQPQEMEGADAGLMSGGVEINCLGRVRLDPVRGFDRPASVAGLDLERLARAVRHRIDKAAGEDLPDLVKPYIAAAVGSGLSQFAEDHDFGK